jgi:hypothetical protein
VNGESGRGAIDEPTWVDLDVPESVFLHRLPLPDELPYRFQPSRLSPFWVRASRLFISYVLRRMQFVRQIDAIGLESLAALEKRGPDAEGLRRPAGSLDPSLYHGDEIAADPLPSGHTTALP